MNPVRTDIKPLILTTAINEEDNTASLALAIEVVGYFDLDEDKAPPEQKRLGRPFRSGANRRLSMRI